MTDLHPLEREILDTMLERRPELQPCVEPLLTFHAALVRTYENGGKLLVCGNGGSNADALHIVGELCKSFCQRRTLPDNVVARLKEQPDGEELARYLEAGLAAITLGTNGSLKTAVENDSPMRDMAFAQEVMALAKPGDVLLAISTSGNARNCSLAMSTARALDVTTVSMTGPDGGAMARMADIAIKAPGANTHLTQESHIVLYHTFCQMVEVHFFPEPR